jgi:FkbM family methyltransferase
MNLIIAKIFRILGKAFNKAANYYFRRQSSKVMIKIIEKGDKKSLYQIESGIMLWLGGNSTIDNSIIDTGSWEPKTTDLIKQIVKRNDTVIDIGANIGYFTILFAKLVGNEGAVYAFEPTNKYFKFLKDNVLINELSNVRIFNKGLSDKNGEMEIFIDDSSATIHQPIASDIKDKEIIRLMTLDEFVVEHDLKAINFIKIDIDGHEPFVLDGAINSIRIFKPVIILEISHLHYYKAGILAWDFYDKLVFWGFHIYYEKDLSEIKDKIDFLVKCGDFSHSVNVLLSLDALNFNVKKLGIDSIL